MERIDELKAGVAVIILNEENQVLLQKRADVGLWGIPSGHVEIGETVSETAIREVKEETNLDIKIKKLIGVYSDPNSQVFVYPSGKVVHFITTCFLAEITGGELRCNSDESLEIKFFEIQNLPHDLLKMHPRWLKDALANSEMAFIR
ncbi:ADP-ribose pyrophosphatase [Schinkia azotoformans MEV2011]|uniref:ADP-ribose pyrophosphatase n=1 Tax=Schinkia azotoformans MEV2011 TaxID=1348973 RepID=A0A072NEB4_SCHAZ|nr:NUDIX domain-containing protein [Schinkia azotoformans]KEF35896.1 ADP-ribose pyrophosphatase [Schinkia azotoformans MEV2011]MEC1698154.1 NUDIX domain-containing protein [Schinkia azotoformans]MEC1717527.1 NUDIX domain-containing protein [Schinkia azotoformans]MEC1726971.1 NUDIX domain-containing protein [Schinkia azotoformans]MEC1743356.1 NUDIX domain-containing protein [Schinkia azotoformans]